jgi:hypothetical protein
VTTIEKTAVDSIRVGLQNLCHEVVMVVRDNAVYIDAKQPDGRKIEITVRFA